MRKHKLDIVLAVFLALTLIVSATITGQQDEAAEVSKQKYKKEIQQTEKERDLARSYHQDATELLGIKNKEIEQKDAEIARLAKEARDLAKKVDSMATDTAYFEKLGGFKLTWYKTNGTTVGTITASGEHVGNHVIAMNAGDIKKYGLSFGDEIVVTYKGKTEFRILLDTGCAPGVVDLYTTGKIPSWGVAPCNIYAKRDGGFR